MQWATFKRNAINIACLGPYKITDIRWAEVEALFRAHGAKMVQGSGSRIRVEIAGVHIKTADWIIDLGPEGGAEGGSIIAVGTPAELRKQSGEAGGLEEVFLKLTAHEPDYEHEG